MLKRFKQIEAQMLYQTHFSSASVSTSATTSNASSSSSSSSSTMHASSHSPFWQRRNMQQSQKEQPSPGLRKI